MSENSLSILWEQIEMQSSSKIPPPREGAICTFIPEKNSIIVFAGQGTNRYNDLWSFDIINKQWIEEKAKGFSPPALSHAAIPYLYFQGGRSNQDKSLSDTYFIDIETYTWRKLFTMEQPSSRFGHKAVRNDDKQAYVFGGCNIGKKEHRFLNDLHKCEYKSIKIVEGEESNVNGASWIPNVACKGVKPAGRKGHSMILINNNIFMFGGELKQGITDENMYKFSIDDKEWSVVNIQGDKLSSSAFSCLLLVNSTNMIIFGGKGKDDCINEIYSIDSKTNECIKLDQTGQIPDKRSDYMSCLIKEGNMIVFGGSNNEGLCALTVYSLKEIKSSIFNQPKPVDYINANVIEKEITDEELETFTSNMKQQQLQQLQPQPQSSSLQKKAINSSSELSNRSLKVDYQQIELRKAKLEEQNKLQAEFINAYKENDKVSKEYQQNLIAIEECHTKQTESYLCEIEKSRKIKETRKNKDKGKEGEIKELNGLINEFLKIHKIKATLILEVFCDYVQDIQKLDEIILNVCNTDLGGNLINYDLINEKRNTYKTECALFYKDFHFYSKYETDLYNTIIKKIKDKEKKGYIEGNHSAISFRDALESDQNDYNN